MEETIETQAKRLTAHIKDDIERERKYHYLMKALNACLFPAGSKANN